MGRFVHVSSPSVAHYGQSLVGASAGRADPDRARGHYARSKAQAELIALAANSPPFPVVAIRPHLIWGPGDTQLVGRIVDRARAGRLAIVGSGASLIDTTYIDNAADALVAALDQCSGSWGKSPCGHQRTTAAGSGDAEQDRDSPPVSSRPGSRCRIGWPVPAELSSSGSGIAG